MNILLHIMCVRRILPLSVIVHVTVVRDFGLLFIAEKNIVSRVVPKTRLSLRTAQMKDDGLLC